MKAKSKVKNSMKNTTAPASVLTPAFVGGLFADLITRVQAESRPEVDDATATAALDGLAEAVSAEDEFFRLNGYFQWSRKPKRGSGKPVNTGARPPETTQVKPEGVKRISGGTPSTGKRSQRV